MLQARTAFSGFSVDDLAKARTFYVDTLGLKIVDEQMGLQLELPGGSQLFIYDKPDHQPATFTVLNFVVDDIDTTVDQLVRDGVIFERYDNIPGGQDEKGIARGKAAGMGPDIAWFKDPAGNVLSIMSV